MERSSNTGGEKNEVQNPNIQSYPDNLNTITRTTTPCRCLPAPGSASLRLPRVSPSARGPSPPKPLRPGPFLPQTLPSPFLSLFRPPLSIARFDWPSTLKPGRPIGEPGWRRWAWPQSRALRSRLPPPLSRQHIPPPLPPPAPQSSSPELLWYPGSGQERAARERRPLRPGERKGADGRAAQAAAGFLGASVRRGGWGGSRGARAGGESRRPGHGGQREIGQPTA